MTVGLSAAPGTLGGLAATPDQAGPVSGEAEQPGGHDSEVTLDRLQLIHEMCADDGIDVVYEDLGAKRRGHYDWMVDKIVLNPRLTRAQEASSCAHELAHRRLGDRCSTGFTERRAWEFAAAMLVLPHEYAEAERKVGHHVNALAAELGVTKRLIESWRRWYLHRCPPGLRLESWYWDDPWGA